MSKKITFWEHIERLKPSDGALLTDGVHLWRYTVRKSGCAAWIETVPEDGSEPQRIYFSSPAPATLEVI